MTDITMDFVHLARLALDNRSEDASMLIRKTLSGLLKRRPDLQPEILEILSRISHGTATRAVAEPLPVDSDSRLELLRRDNDPQPEVEPVWPDAINAVLSEVVLERGMDKELREHGTQPTRSLLFKGPPGTGKSLAARWLAYRLHYPLLTLDLSAVMSSFLGKTGNNIRVVLDYARRTQSVLLLDEFDAIAKRRDDVAEIGELKRLVTVLLQEIDSWPSYGILVAATNHPDLLDPAVWRRFDRIVDFVLPTEEELFKLLNSLLPPSQVDPALLPVLSRSLHGISFADANKIVNAAKRSALVHHMMVQEALLSLCSDHFKGRNLKDRLALAAIMRGQGLSQRQTSALTGLSRDTLRTRMKASAEDESIEGME